MYSISCKIGNFIPIKTPLGHPGLQNSSKEPSATTNNKMKGKTSPTHQPTRRRAAVSGARGEITDTEQFGILSIIHITRHTSSPERVAAYS